MLTDGVIFDLDGTLWDSCRVVAESWGETLRRLDPAAVCPGPDEVRGIMGMTAPQIARTLFSQYGAEAEAVCLTCIREENEYIAARGGELYPELEETLAALSACVPLFIVSNCLDGYIQCFLHSSGLGRYFRDFECEGSTGLEKAEIEKTITPHILRNSFAVHMVQNGADIKSLQELLGHEDISATEVYLTQAKSRIKDVYDKTHPRA